MELQEQEVRSEPSTSVTHNSINADNDNDNANANDTDADTNPNSKRQSLLSCVKSLVELELSLTQTLSNTKPLLELATPQTMSQVNTILSLARTYSTRTSAPPGWNPNLPVIHFSTPSPLAHQLRQGALGAMELNLVKEERIAKRRKVELDLLNRKLLEESMRRKKSENNKLNANANANNANTSGNANDPKRREIRDHEKMEDDEETRRKMEKKRAAIKKHEAKVAASSMNLSDSDDSSSEEGSDSD